MLSYCNIKKFPLWFASTGETQICSFKVDPFLNIKFLRYGSHSVQKVTSFVTYAEKGRRTTPASDAIIYNDISRTRSYDKQSGVAIKKKGTKEHHLWQKRDSARSGLKALNLVRNISELPNEKEAVYGALDKWIAWETEFPLIAAAKALRILRKRSRWTRVIQV